jgi:YD repeat-containing protein
VFDQLNRLKQATDAKSGIALFAYDARDNLIGATDQRGLVTTYVLDGFDNVIQVTSPDTGTTVFQTDRAGNVTQVVDGRGVTVNMSYDALNRMATKTFPASATENMTLTYDSVAGGNFGKGRLTGIVDESGSTALVYDRRGNIVTETKVIQGTSHTTSHSWNLADRPIRETYPSGRIVDYARDSQGRIAGVTTRHNAGAAPITVAASLTYKPFGPLAGLSLGNGLVQTRVYDADYRLTDLDVAGGGTTIQDLAYGYDGRDDVTSITDALVPSRSQLF